MLLRGWHRDSNPEPLIKFSHHIRVTQPLRQFNKSNRCPSLELDLSSPVGFGEQDGQVGFSDEVLVCHFADGDDLFLSPGHDLQGQRGFHLRPQHAEVRRQQVDEDLKRKQKR